MDKLFQEQKDFTEAVLRKLDYDLATLTVEDRVLWTKEYVLAISKEVCEVLDNIDWKHHRKKVEKTIPENVVEELIDLQKYVWGLFSIWGVDYQHFVEAFHQKSFVVRERWRQENCVIKAPTAVVDIDGVICEYPNSFLSWTKQHYPELLTLSKRENPIRWEEAKHKYRLENGKREAILVNGAVNFFSSLKKNGWSIILFTHRPVQLYKGIEYDTLWWLNQSGIQYDKLVWASVEKSFYLSTGILEADLFIDDDIETCKSVASLGKKVYCKNYSDSNILSFSSLGEIIRNEFRESV